ncbi:uncharacterized protein LOC117269892 isoform X2 [Epinephelus lanceolatus]
MSTVEYLRVFVSERLTAAAVEILGVFEKTIVEYEKEIDRQRILLDIAWKPEVRLYRTELPQQDVCKEEEVVAEQQLCIEERKSSVDQEEPEPPQIKEEEEEVCSSQEGEQLEVKQETETFLVTPTDEESEQQLLCHSSYGAESEDEEGDEQGDSTSTGEAEPEQQSQHDASNTHTNRVDNPSLSEIDHNTCTGGRHICSYRMHICR